MIGIVQLVFQLFSLMVLLRIVASWFPKLYEYTWMMWVCSCTDPYLQFFRRILPPLGGFDFSPVLALVSLEILERIVLSLLL